MRVINAILIININRENLFNDAFNRIIRYTPSELKRRLKIKYRNEEGEDAGGLLR